MTSNYNVIYLFSGDKHPYKVGDIFILPKIHRSNSKLMKFDGIKIKNIDCCIGTRLHFDWLEWEKNNPQPEFEKNNTSNFKLCL